jgi:predicted AAA+ superfamily ATPase
VATPSIASAVITRHAQVGVEEALLDTRVVVILGARQVGKSTLVNAIAHGAHPSSILTLDDQTTREAARADPTGFVAGLSAPVVIDEVQRVPDLLLAIKQRVDRDTAPGRFLLTGSANILTAPTINDALTGRAEYLRLHPFSQGELRGTPETFLSELFAGRVPQIDEQPIGREAYVELLAAGGYPEALRRAPHRRAAFFSSYLDTIVQRDLTSLSQITQQASVRQLLNALAATSAGELNVARLSGSLGIPAATIRNYLDLLETLFLIERVPAWSNNLLSRVIRAPKVHITDTGLLCFLIGADAKRLANDLNLGGPIFETFTAMELARQASWHPDRPSMFHFRDKDQREVDLVLERRDGSVAGVECKAAASVNDGDFRGLKHLRDKLGERFAVGVVMYTGERSVPFGDRLFAVPYSGLWS